MTSFQYNSIQGKQNKLYPGKNVIDTGENSRGRTKSLELMFSEFCL